jgi:hypothetical protein
MTGVILTEREKEGGREGEWEEEEEMEEGGGGRGG